MISVTFGAREKRQRPEDFLAPIDAVTMGSAPPHTA
jgi:hypothetical protein